jgi:very-short-patch-repair endonuclease
MQEYLRSLRQWRAHFRREAPIGTYVVDFARLSARIVIEVDGDSHRLPGRAKLDSERDAFLRSQGFSVIRVNDADAIANASRAFLPIEDAVRPLLKWPFTAVAGSQNPPPPCEEGLGEGSATTSPTAGDPSPSPPCGLPSPHKAERGGGQPAADVG